MAEFQTLGLVFAGVVAMMVALAVVLRFGDETERKARMDSLNERSPLGGASEEARAKRK